MFDVKSRPSDIHSIGVQRGIDEVDDIQYNDLGVLVYPLKILARHK